MRHVKPGALVSHMSLSEYCSGAPIDFSVIVYASAELLAGAGATDAIELCTDTLARCVTLQSAPLYHERRDMSEVSESW